MAATTPLDNSMDKLLVQLQKDHPQLSFVAGKAFYWSPANRQVVYKTNAEGPTAVFSLLHEVGHALLDHKRYRLDFELLELEVAAWERAKLLGVDYDTTIDEDHIQDCLDTYRDWLYRRSICPSCTTKALQQDDEPVYSCFNCHATWRVAPSRFCRPYRQTKTQAAVFASSQADV
jgi:hypothetical protein